MVYTVSCYESRSCSISKSVAGAMKDCADQRGDFGFMRTRWLRPLIIGAATCCALLLSASASSAQLPSPGYSFAEVTDETDRPVFGAGVAVYNGLGDEIAASVTDSVGSVRLVMNGYVRERFIVRIIKTGCLTYEGVFETSGAYRNSLIKIKMICESRPKVSAKVSAKSFVKPVPSGPSPPANYSRARDRAPP